MCKEEWRPVVGFEGAYEVSSLGVIRSLERKDSRGSVVRPQIMKQYPICGGYLRVYLTKDGKQHPIPVHRVVAGAFIPNPNNLPQINHKNEIKTDNFVGNLEWCTAKYNSNYGTRKERVAKSRGMRVARMDADGNVLEVYDSISDATRKMGGGSIGNIWAVVRGYRADGVSHNTAFGYRWKLIQE